MIARSSLTRGKPCVHWVGGSVAQEAFETEHSVGGGVGLLGAEGTGCGEETCVDGSTIVQQVAYGYL